MSRAGNVARVRLPYCYILTRNVLAISQKTGLYMCNVLAITQANERDIAGKKWRYHYLYGGKLEIEDD